MDLNDLKGKTKDVLRSTGLDEKVGAAANQMKEKVQGVLDKTSLDEKIKSGADKLREKAGKTAPTFQFMRLGYFCLDNKDSSAEHIVFNRSVSLKDSFKR